MPEDWTRKEVEAVVTNYLAMLDLELRGGPYNKAEHNRRLRVLLNGRSKGSVERKHQNISAVLLELGHPWIDGYKPLSNVQRLLREVVNERLSTARELGRLIAQAVEHPPIVAPRIADLLAIQVDPPAQTREATYGAQEESVSDGVLARRNYLEIEARNQSLGLAGEKLVLEFEHQRLWQAGAKRLADRIEHVARTKGDHLGYDISSFEITGEERLIEVKTTQFGALTPFFASRNELAVSDKRERHYRLCRVYHFNRDPRFFTLSGAIRKHCRLEAVEFSATLL